MAKKYRDTDYLCLSAQIRSRENALLRRSQLDRMLESGDAKQAARILAEQGWESFDPTQPGALDAAILTQREALYRELSGQLPDDAVLAVFRLKYDCHNIKTLIKARGADVSALLLDAGTIPAQELAQLRRESEGCAFSPRRATRGAVTCSSTRRALPASWSWRARAAARFLRTMSAPSSTARTSRALCARSA